MNLFSYDFNLHDFVEDENGEWQLDEKVAECYRPIPVTPEKMEKLRKFFHGGEEI